jgi:uncharacterized protein
MLVYKTPGVYIEELPATGPIAGVGTSVAAFVGPAQAGPLFTPTKITNPTQFRTLFGDYLTAPRFYMAYGVRGFFENGGTVAYVVRVGTAQRAFLELDDRGGAGGKAVRVEALQEGAAGNNLQVTVADAQVVAAGNNARVRKARFAIASAAADSVKLQSAADAAQFRPGDVITIDGTAERVAIDRVRTDELLLAANLAAGPYAAGQFVRIANLVVNQKTFRVENNAGIEPGSVIQLDQGGNQDTVVVEAVNNEFVTLAGAGLTKPFGLAQGDADVVVTSLEFSLVVSRPVPPLTENFLKLSMDPRHSRYYRRVVNSALVAVTPPPVPSVQPPPGNRPLVGGPTNLAGGANDNLAALGLNHFQAGLAALEKVDDVNLVCMPDRTDTGGQGALVAHCEKMGDRFGLLDSAFNAPPFGAGSVLGQRAAVESARGYAALYYPWVQINDPASATGEDTLLIPPSGHLAGIYARSDTERGVHKAPANELIRGVVGLERVLDDVEQGELNVEGVNVLRIFPGKARPNVWGARTTAPKDETAWRYVNVRRLFLFVEESIKVGIRWAVFEPNDLSLWKKLHRTLTEFLTRVWRSGALFGATADQAFYVKIDEELNPASVRALGQVIIEIGLAPVRPAEFVIVRIGMWEGGAEVSET